MTRRGRLNLGSNDADTHGPVRYALLPEKISGGSGSAVAVDIADIVLGTDTVGSGRAQRHRQRQAHTGHGPTTSGHHPITGFVDHGPGGAGEPVVGLLRAGKAGGNTAADHITATQLALANAPRPTGAGAAP